MNAELNQTTEGRRWRGGLTRRTLVASSLLALLVGAALAVLTGAITAQRHSAQLATRSQEALVDASALERLVLDLETGQRGYVIVREESLLGPWRSALGAFPKVSRRLMEAAGGVPAQAARARRLNADIASYIDDYSVPQVSAARRNSPSARTAAALDEGKRRVDGIRREFERFFSAERTLFAARQRRADALASQAVRAAAFALAGSIALIILFQAYIGRAIVLPIRRAASMAQRLASGDLAARMPENGPAEIRALERDFNTMAGSLQESRRELGLLANEQAALRRVATLVARAVPASEIFAATAAEVQALLGADKTRLLRYDEDGAATVIAGGPCSGDDPLAGERIDLEDPDVIGEVLRTGRAARVDSYAVRHGSSADRVRRQGIRCSVAAPIIVGDRLWGVMAAAWKRDDAVSADTEHRMAQFTELVATAIANAESRAELAASRARVVATADETRRRIERDLHDGAQQRLVHTVITLKLARRAMAEDGPEAAELVDEALAHAQHATKEIRELAHGILPAALRRGGLKPALNSLVARVRVPVSLDVTHERLSPATEATAYFIVAEALTNAAKHSGAGQVSVSAVTEDGTLRLEVRDDGVGGARINGSSGLLGLADRAAAIGGRLDVHSPPGQGTAIVATLPVQRRERADETVMA